MSIAERKTTVEVHLQLGAKSNEITSLRNGVTCVSMKVSSQPRTGLLVGGETPEKAIGQSPGSSEDTKSKTWRYKVKGSFEAKLHVNKISVEMNPFAEELLARTMVGAVASLKGAEDIKSLEIHQEKGNVEITVNGNEIPITPFPNDIISNTLTSLVSSLKGVDKIDSLDISIKVQ